MYYWLIWAKFANSQLSHQMCQPHLFLLRRFVGAALSVRPIQKGVGPNLMLCCHRLFLLQAQAFRYFTIAKRLRILFDVQ